MRGFRRLLRSSQGGKAGGEDPGRRGFIFLSSLPGAGPGRPRTRQRGFTLLEVLVALGLAAVALGILLSSAGLQATTIARAERRYQLLTTASALVEERAGQRQSGSEEGQIGDLAYQVRSVTVPADPRFAALQVQVYAPDGLQATMSAYRLRAVHQEQAPEGQEPSAP